MKSRRELLFLAAGTVCTLPMIVHASAHRPRITPSAEQTFQFDMRPGHVNVTAEEAYDLITFFNGKRAGWINYKTINGQFGGAVAADQVTGQILVLTLASDGSVYVRPTPCACQPGMHMLFDDGRLCVPLTLLEGHVRVYHRSSLV